MKIRKWSKQALRDDPTFPPGYPQPPNLLFDRIFPGGFLDLVVRVLHVSGGDDEYEHTASLIVWDGSGDTMASKSSCTDLLKERGIAIPPHGILKQISFDSCWGLLQDFGFTDGLLTNWCRFRNLTVVEEVNAAREQAALRFREGASLMFLPEYVQDVQARLEIGRQQAPASLPEPTQQQQYHDQQNGSSPPVSTMEKQVWTLVPEYIRSEVPVTSLLDVQSSEVVPRKYHCAARFKTIWPADITKITKLQQQSEAYVYSFVVRLEDDSGLIDVIVYGKDAVRLCNGVSVPVDAEMKP